MQAPAYQQVLPRAAVQMAAPQRTAQLSVAAPPVGNVQTERAEARRTSFQVWPAHVCVPVRGASLC